MAEAGGQQWQRRTSLARRVMLQRLRKRASFSKPQRDGLCDQGADERLLKSQLSMRCALIRGSTGSRGYREKKIR